MKKLKYIICLLSFVVLFSSCSNDDGPGPSAQSNKVGLFSENIRPITAPEKMKNSDDPKASEAVGILENANEFTDLENAFEIPEEAVKRDQPVAATNARISSNGYTIYEWRYGEEGNMISMIWQYSEPGNQELYEVFMGVNDEDYILLYEVLQNKDGKKGSLNWFGVMKWNWEIKDNESYHIDFNYVDFISYKIISNKDLSGSIKVYSNDALIQEYEWNKNGNGSWKKYSEGEEVDSGTW